MSKFARHTWHQRERQRRITRLMARDGTCCSLCGGELDRKLVDEIDPLYITFDHVVPLALGGADDERNMKLAHNACNNAKGDAVASG